MDAFSKKYMVVWAGRAENLSLLEAWSKISKKLAFYEYIGNNSAKGGKHWIRQRLDFPV